MTTTHQSGLPLSRRARLWLSTPIVARIIMLAGAMFVGYGYSVVWMPHGGGSAADVAQVTREVVGGILAVIFGAAVVGAVALWHD